MSKNVPSNHEPPISPADWDAIVAAAFSPDAEPHVFSNHYQKQKQKQEEFLMPKKSIRGRKTIVIAAILAAAVVAIPTSAYAVNRIYQASIQSTGSYQKDVVIDAGDSTLDTRTQSLQVGWMPDGMTLDKSSGKYHDDQNRGVTMLFWKMQDGDFLQTVNRGIVHSETKTINGNQVFFLQRDSANLPDGQMDYRNIVWVAFSNTPYAAQFYATDDLTKEELTQIAEHLSLSPAEQETASTVLCNRRPHERRVDTDCRTSFSEPSRTGNGKPLAAGRISHRILRRCPCNGLRCQQAFVCQHR